jgi:pilus biogenesis lipoprotein CpaD
MFERHEFLALAAALLIAACAFAAALLLSACAPMGATWTADEAPTAPKISIGAESYVVKLDGKARNLPQGEHEELQQFLSHLGDLSAVEFSIRRTHKDLSLAALVLVEKELIAMGANPKRVVRLAEIGFDYQGEWADVEIIAKRYIAAGPNCPNWSRVEINDNLNLESSNFGCATSAALALSIADPRDLVRGRDTDGAPGAHEVPAITRYKTDTVKPIREESTQNQH